MANFVNNKKLLKGLSVASGPKAYAHQLLRPIMSNKWQIRKGTGGLVASFLIKTIVLEAVRRFSRAKCPFMWTGLQGLQVLCYPPLKWIQCWNPFRYLVRGMQMISQPLLVLSIVNALSDHSDCSNSLVDDSETSPSVDDCQLSSESLSGGPSLQCNESMRIGDEHPQGPSSTDWIDHLREELENQGITLPERVEHGVLHLLAAENPQITVLMDCQGLSSLRFPMQTMRYCCNILQDHFPNTLGCLIVIRLPSVVRVLAQTFIQVLKPTTKQKLRIEGQMYGKVLSECFQILPSYLGGSCTCTRCLKLDAGSLKQIPDTQNSNMEQSFAADIVGTENFPLEEPTYQHDMEDNIYCSRVLRSAVIGVLIIWVLIAFIEGLYNPESRPSW
ncbi:hypothetical protein OROGR_012933 [Orobanche gracilis]